MTRQLLIVSASAIALVLVLFLAQRTLLRIGSATPAEPTAQTTGIIKSMDATPSVFTQTPQRASVTLANGSQVRATVLPGCAVQPGDMVQVHIHGFRPTQALYLVVGPAQDQPK